MQTKDPNKGKKSFPQAYPLGPVEKTRKQTTDNRWQSLNVLGFLRHKALNSIRQNRVVK